MGKKFFTAWATWEKLTFILACALVVTASLACGKLYRTHMKLRKYRALAEAEKLEQAMSRQMSQPRRAQGNNEHDVPFGVRAIESGVEVEGVWISRNNTPEPPASRDTSKSSVWDHVPRKDFAVDLEKALPQTHDRSASNSTNKTARPESSFERAVSVEPLVSSLDASRDPSPDAAPTITRPPKTKQYPPSSYAKYSGNPAVRESSSISAIEGIDAVFRASGYYHRNGDSVAGEGLGSSDSSGQSTGDSADVEPIAASAPRLLNQEPRPQARPRQQSNDLDLMHSHRMSQAAETGQLTPRVRKPGFSGEWASIANAGTSASSSEQGDYFGRSRTRSLSPAKERSSAIMNGTTGNGLPVLPKLDTLPPAVRRSSLPDVTPFVTFCRTAPQSPLQPDGGYRPSSPSDSKASPARSSSWTEVGEAINRFVSAPSSPLIGPSDAPPSTAPAPAPAALPPPQIRALPFETDKPPQQSQPPPPPQPHHPCRSSFENRQSQVVRGHGSGFEILRPGTFRVPSTDPPAASQKHRPFSLAGPPISLPKPGSSVRPRSSSADSRHKLQKKKKKRQGSETGRGESGECRIGIER